MATVDQVDKAASTDNRKPDAQETLRGGKAGKADKNDAAAKAAGHAAETVKKTGGAAAKDAVKTEKGGETPAEAEKKKAAGSSGAFKEKDEMDEEVKTVKVKAAPEKAAARKTAAAAETAAVKGAPKKEKAPKAAPKAVASAAEEPEKAKAKAAPKKAAAPKAEAVKEEPKKEEAKAAPKKAAAPKAEAVKEEPKKEEAKAAPKKAAAPKAEAVKEEPKKEEAAPAIKKEAQKPDPAPAPAAKTAAAASAQAAKPAQAAAAPKKKEAAPAAKRTSQNRMRDYYKKTVVPQLMKEFAFKNINEVPRLEKITLNMRMGDIKDNSKSVNSAMDELKTISGQRPVSTKARKSLANWKIREGMIIGAKVTLRGDRMYDFYDKLVSIALPRVRDFRGVSPKAFDGRGNYATGIKEQLIFPEISYEQVEKVRGFDICIVTSAETDEHAKALLKAMGMPFKA